MFAGPFAPENWHFCDGTILAVQQNQALFNVIGSTYGGDGVHTFALPDLRSRIPLGASANPVPGLTAVALGAAGGEESHVLTQSEMPSHRHSVYVSNVNGGSNSPSSTCALAALVTSSLSPANAYAFSNPNMLLNSGTIATMGANQGHENRQPFVAVNYIICTFGVYPPRS